MPKKPDEVARIIEAIPHKGSFSINELSHTLNTHPLRVRRILNVLYTMRLVNRVKKAYLYRVWSINRTLWPPDPVEAYRWWKAGYPRAFLLAKKGQIKEARLTYE